MILELMDSRYLKRFLLLDYLHINQNHSIELMELVKLSQVSYPTVKKIITDIRMDIIDLGYSEYVELIDLPEQNKVIWNVKKNFSLMIFRLYYFLICQIKLDNMFLSMQLKNTSNGVR